MHFHRDLLAICRLLPAHVLQAAARTTSSSARRRSPSPSGWAGSLLVPAARRRGRRCCWSRRAPAQLLQAIAAIAPPSASPRPPPTGRCWRCSPGTTCRQPAQVRLGRRDAAAGDLRGLARGHRAADHRRHRRDRDAAHLHRARRRRDPPRLDRHGGARATRRRSSTTQGARCRAATIGRLAVRGPTGCRYLADERQRDYVQDGWNFTGDAYRAGRRRLLLVPGAHRRHDHLVRLQHRRAGGRSRAAGASRGAECGVVGAPDEERGQIVKAYVVLRAGHAADPRPCAGAAGVRQGEDRALQISARDRVRASAAAHRRPASSSASPCAGRPRPTPTRC